MHVSVMLCSAIGADIPISQMQNYCTWQAQALLDTYQNIYATIKASKIEYGKWIRNMTIVECKYIFESRASLNLVVTTGSF